MNVRIGWGGHFWFRDVLGWEMMVVVNGDWWLCKVKFSFLIGGCGGGNC